MAVLLRENEWVGEELSAQGYSVATENGVSVGYRHDGQSFTQLDEENVNAIISTFDSLPFEKSAKVAELKREGLRRINVVFPAVQDFDELDLIREQYLSVAPAARNATAAFQKLIDIVQAGKAASVIINGYDLTSDITSYDVVNTPSWPA